MTEQEIKEILDGLPDLASMTGYDVEQSFIGYFAATRQYRRKKDGAVVTDYAQRMKCARAESERLLPHLVKLQDKQPPLNEVPECWRALALGLYAHAAKGLPPGKRTPSVLTALVSIAGVIARTAAVHARRRVASRILESDDEFQAEVRRELGVQVS
jgi:hypothetical protein